MLEPLVAPLTFVSAMLIAATTAHRRLPPQLSVRFISAAVLITLTASIPTVLLLAVAFLAHIPVVGLSFQWCTQAIGLHSSASAWLGLPAVALVASGTFRALRLVRARRALLCNHDHSVQLVNSPLPFAVTLPGAAGRILVSSRLWTSLDSRERQVVLAHERSHAIHRHDRLVFIAELAAALFPPLTALTRRLLFSIERWADEDAARCCGDRDLVAMTLGKVALHTQLTCTPSFAARGVAGRMRALLDAPRTTPTRRHIVVLWALLAASSAVALLQLHHLERLVLILCPH